MRGRVIQRRSSEKKRGTEEDEEESEERRGSRLLAEDEDEDEDEDEEEEEAEALVKFRSRLGLFLDDEELKEGIGGSLGETRSIGSEGAAAFRGTGFRGILAFLTPIFKRTRCPTFQRWRRGDKELDLESLGCFRAFRGERDEVRLDATEVDVEGDSSISTIEEEVTFES